VPVNVAHATPYSTPNNPELVAGAKKVEYQIASVVLNAASQPTVKFRVLVDGAPLNLKSLPANGIAIGASNLKLAWSKPMAAPLSTANGPAMAAPLDWNNLGSTAGRTYWNNDVTMNLRAYDQPMTVSFATGTPAVLNAALIASLTGLVVSNSNGQVVVDVQGVGYLVHSTSATVGSISQGDSVNFHTSLVVREDAWTLFGFETRQELEVFELLRSVNGVGPKSALSILNQLSVEQIAQAVAEESDESFKAVSGIGSKTAKLITVTLAGKFVSSGSNTSSASGSESAVSALVGLGWSERQAREALQQVGSKDFSDKQLLKAALQVLSKARKG
jgi:Holliday junction DNA helicase RuvA